MVLGQIGRPWQPTEMGSGPEVAPGEFAAFARPGFAKIALSLRVQPYGASGTILTLETRVALTDAASLRRFRRYWRLIGPFSHLVRWLALRQLVADLGGATRVRLPADRGWAPWKYTVDAASCALLEATGWTTPDPESAPIGRDIVERYLEPLGTGRAQ